MYDALTGRFTFPCPARGETRVTLSDFRQLERLPGAAHPSVFHVLFACGCGKEHEGLVTHDDLDWGPLGLQGGTFYNVMTAQLDRVVTELSDVAARRIQAGEWPWSFFCYPEDRPRARPPSLPQRPQGRSGGARLQRRRRRCNRGVPRRALLRLVRHPPPDPLETGFRLGPSRVPPGYRLAR